jgi:hypothetical protein
MITLHDDATNVTWWFAINPIAQEWTLYRSQQGTSVAVPFYQPRGFVREVPGELQSIEVQIVDGKPTLLINDVDVVGPEFPMPAMKGDYTVGVGILRSPAEDDTFTVVFKRVELRRVQ